MTNISEVTELLNRVQNDFHSEGMASITWPMQLLQYLEKLDKSYPVKWTIKLTCDYVTIADILYESRLKYYIESILLNDSNRMTSDELMEKSEEIWYLPIEAPDGSHIEAAEDIQKQRAFSIRFGADIRCQRAVAVLFFAVAQYRNNDPETNKTLSRVVRMLSHDDDDTTVFWEFMKKHFMSYCVGK